MSKLVKRLWSALGWKDELEDSQDDPAKPNGQMPEQDDLVAAG